MTATAQPKVFISYRREETAGHAGRLYDVMSSHFGDQNVFMDVDIAPGVDFVQRIKDAVGGCHVLLVIIGPRWSTITNGSIAPRLADPGDFVRLEVEEGLRRADVTVIPVLVGGARMPGQSELPRELHPLSRRNALELSDTRWRYDVDRLLGTLDNLLAGTSAVTPRPQPLPAALRPEPTRAPGPQPAGGVRLALLTALLAGIVGLVARWIIGALRHSAPGYTAVKPGGGVDWTHVPTSERIQHIIDPEIWNGFTWAAIGIAVVVWLSIRRRGTFPSFAGLAAGGLVGALGGVLGTAVYGVTRHLMNPDGAPSGKHRDLLLILGVAVTGALAGSLVGWFWGRRGSAGFAAGLLAGALWEAIVIATGWSGPRDFVAKAGLGALVIVGLVALAQAGLDEWEARARPAPA